MTFVKKKKKREEMKSHEQETNVWRLGFEAKCWATGPPPFTHRKSRMYGCCYIESTTENINRQD